MRSFEACAWRVRRSVRVVLQARGRQAVLGSVFMAWIRPAMMGVTVIPDPFMLAWGESVVSTRRVRVVTEAGRERMLLEE